MGESVVKCVLVDLYASDNRCNVKAASNESPDFKPVTSLIFAAGNPSGRYDMMLRRRSARGLSFMGGESKDSLIDTSMLSSRLKPSFGNAELMSSHRSRRLTGPSPLIWEMRASK